MTKTSDSTTLLPGERNAMLRLVKMDFEQVRNEIEAAQNGYIRDRYAAVDAEYATQAAAYAAYNVAAERLKQRVEGQFRELWEKHLSGVPKASTRTDIYYAQPPKEPPAVAKAKERIRNEAAQIAGVALSNLRREEIEATKKLLKSAIVSEEAQVLMASLPKAEEAFRNAALGRSSRSAIKA